MSSIQGAADGTVPWTASAYPEEYSFDEWSPVSRALSSTTERVNSVWQKIKGFGSRLCSSLKKILFSNNKIVRLILLTTTMLLMIPVTTLMLAICVVAVALCLAAVPALLLIGFCAYLSQKCVASQKNEMYQQDTVMDSFD